MLPHMCTCGVHHTAGRCCCRSYFTLCLPDAAFHSLFTSRPSGCFTACPGRLNCPWQGKKLYYIFFPGLFLLPPVLLVDLYLPFDAACRRLFVQMLLEAGSGWWGDSSVWLPVVPADRQTNHMVFLDALASWPDRFVKTSPLLLLFHSSLSRLSQFYLCLTQVGFFLFILPGVSQTPAGLRKTEPGLAWNWGVWHRSVLLLTRVVEASQTRELLARGVGSVVSPLAGKVT